jgi:isopentenyl diphosphate isomerase/L-lactate dehydrogenase-like FMN-dependent dehydrogenase
MARSVAPPHVLNISDLRRLAKRRLPRVVFDYIDGGADAEVTLRDNVKAYEELTFRPRGAVAIPSIDLKTTILGAPLDLPFILAPVGSTRLFYPNGEVLAARAAGKAGTAYVLSTLSGTPMEQVRAATSGPAWYQVYLCGGREASINMLKRAKAAGFTALVVTIDTGVPGLRERDLRNGIKELLGRGISGLPYLGQMIARPAWIAGMLADGGLMKFPNVLLPTGPMPYADVGKTLEESVVCWDDLRWIRDLWHGKIIVKGVHTAEDAERVVAEGADALVVSNHGGRQLDGVPGSIRSLPEVVSAVGNRIEVLVDGGIRNGGDIVKALALGARGVLVGRAYAYGLSAAGEPGVTRAIEILRSGIVRTMKLLGVASLRELNRSYIDVPAGWLPGDARTRN